MSWLTSPWLFQYVIIGLYSTNALQFLLRGMWVDGCYWLSALAITLTVTFGYQR